MHISKANEADHVSLEHLARPGDEPGDNPHHFVLVRVNGENIDLEVIGVDWGRNFQPYRTRKMNLQEDTVR